MQRWRGYEAVPGGWGRSVVTIGVFDGVHRGHQAIIGHTVKRARDLGLQSVVVTFDPHPAEVVRPGSHPAVLTEPVRKAELIEQLGVDALCVLPFTAALSRLTAEAFVHDVLVEHLHAAVVVEGENFRFGHRAAGDVALLERLGRTFGFTVEGAPLVADGGTIFSSTYIRACVDAGDVRTAAAALGRAHRLAGVVVRGDQRGRELGFPTANLMCHRYAAVPADGVYAGWLVRGGDGRAGAGPADRGRPHALPASVSIGTNPTFSGRERRVEAYVLDFAGDLYGERVSLDFVEQLREQRRYEGIEPLVAQIREDVEQTRSVLDTPAG
jgi:riboflavin kinase/FMN adenylyltransferase